jgi:uncharacterized membrane protein YeaQ/YmgE (transglycosylase-associated protein family)
MPQLPLLPLAAFLLLLLSWGAFLGAEMQKAALGRLLGKIEFSAQWRDGASVKFDPIFLGWIGALIVLWVIDYLRRPK